MSSFRKHDDIDDDDDDDDNNDDDDDDDDEDDRLYLNTQTIFSKSWFTKEV